MAGLSVYRHSDRHSGDEVLSVLSSGFETKEIVRVTGPVASGKTEFLIKQAVSFLCGGQMENVADKAQSVCIVAASRQHAEDIRNRLSVFAQQVAAEGAFPANDAGVGIEGTGDAEDSSEDTQDMGSVSENAQDIHDMRIDISRIQVKTASALCCELLSTEAARKATGRMPRILLRAEEELLVSDMVSSGCSAKALKYAIARYKKALETNGLSDDKDFPALAIALGRREAASASVVSASDEDIFASHGVEKVSGEAEADGGNTDERLCRAFVQKLRSRSAMIEDELAAVAAYFLASDEGASFNGRLMCVLLDDAQYAGAALMSVCARLSMRLFVVAEDEAQIRSDTQASFLSVRPSVQVSVLPSVQACEISDFSQALRACIIEDAVLPVSVQRVEQNPHDALLSGMGSYHHDKREESTHRFGEAFSPLMRVKWRTPDDEFRGLARLVGHMLAADEALTSGDIVVAVPNRTWAKSVCQALSARGMRSQMFFGTPTLRRALRDQSCAKIYAAFSLLALAVDKADVAAWRTWYAFGEAAWQDKTWYDLASREADRRLAFSAASKCSDESARAYRQACAFIEDLLSLRGMSLLDRLIEHIGCKDITEVLPLKMLYGDEDVFSLFKLLQAQMFDEILPLDVRAINIVPYTKAVGFSCRVLIVAGAVEGLAFSDRASEEHRNDGERYKNIRALQELYAISGKPQDLLMFSSFQRMDLDAARKMHIDIHRQKLVHGKRMAVVSALRLIEKAGDSVVPTVSGEQLLGMCPL